MDGVKEYKGKKWDDAQEILTEMLQSKLRIK